MPPRPGSEMPVSLLLRLSRLALRYSTVCELNADESSCADQVRDRCAWSQGLAGQALCRLRQVRYRGRPACHCGIQDQRGECEVQQGTQDWLSIDWTGYELAE